MSRLNRNLNVIIGYYQTQSVIPHPASTNKNYPHHMDSIILSLRRSKCQNSQPLIVIWQGRNNDTHLRQSTSLCLKKQTWNLSKNLQDRRFQGKKFTQKTRNFRHLLNCDKKCVNALNWDKTSKKSLFYQFIWAQHQ